MAYTRETWPFRGTCVDCPQDPGTKTRYTNQRPWECKYKDRVDHLLQGNNPKQWEGFVKNRERATIVEWLRSPAAQLGAIVAGCPATKAKDVCFELAHTFDCPQDLWEDPGDKPIPEDAQIQASHPLTTGRHDLYNEAMRLVGAKRSKGALVELVNWLLHEREERK